MGNHSQEVARGERFAFGANWVRFLELLDDGKIAMAEQSLLDMLQVDHLQGYSFLDVGSGSGLFSLAARRLGARVRSFDYDPQSVACTAELKCRYFPDDPDWIVEEGSALDVPWLESLGRYDIVYSWGVLHHTGCMWNAIGNAVSRVAENGQLFIAIYNNQGWISHYWRLVKQIYNRSGFGRVGMILLHMPYLCGLRWLARKMSGRPLERGMDLWRDAMDWLGGYPFEVAQPVEIVRFIEKYGFLLSRQKTCGRRMGCNEFVFRRIV